MTQQKTANIRVAMILIYSACLFFLFIGMILSILSIPLLLVLYIFSGVINGFRNFIKDFPSLIGHSYVKSVVDILDRKYFKKQLKNDQ